MNDQEIKSNILRALGFLVIKNGTVKFSNKVLFDIQEFKPGINAGIDTKSVATVKIMTLVNNSITRLLLAALERLITNGGYFKPKVIGRFLRKGVTQQSFTTTKLIKLKTRLRDGGSVLLLTPKKHHWELTPSNILNEEEYQVISNLIKFFKLRKVKYASNWGNVNTQWGQLVGLAKALQPVYNGVKRQSIKVKTDITDLSDNPEQGVTLNTLITERDPKVVKVNKDLPPWDIEGNKVSKPTKKQKVVNQPLAKRPPPPVDENVKTGASAFLDLYGG